MKNTISKTIERLDREIMELRKQKTAILIRQKIISREVPVLVRLKWREEKRDQSRAFDAKLFNAYKAGISFRDIAKKHGISYQTVRNRVKRHERFQKLKAFSNPSKKTFVSDLDLSSRAWNVLQCFLNKPLNETKITDLDGASIKFLMRYRNCGVMVIAEIDSTLKSNGFKGLTP